MTPKIPNISGRPNQVNTEVTRTGLVIFTEPDQLPNPMANKFSYIPSLKGSEN